MQLTLNGRTHEHKGTGTLQSLLDEIGADADRVAMLVNDEVIAKNNRNSVALNTGDRVEILSFAGGG